MTILWILAGFIAFPIVMFVLGNLFFISSAIMGTRVTGGLTPEGRHVNEGQIWRLNKDIDKELRTGLFLVAEFYGDRVLLKRKDGRHDLPQGCLPIFDIEIMDRSEFVLLGDAK